jgi:predicted PurR-regulated permease PerM
VQKVLFVVGVLIALVLAYKLASLWMLMFGAIIFAVILRVMAEPMIRFTPLGQTISVLIAFVVLVAGLSAAFYFFGRQIVEDTQTLAVKLPKAWRDLQGRLDDTAVGQNILSQFNATISQASSVLSQLPRWAGSILSSVANLIIVVVAGIFMAFDPAKYRNGLVILFPKDRQGLAHDMLNMSGRALKLWFLGQFISMILVGTLVAAGLFFIGVPSALALGLIAGLAQFVPLVGPIIAAVPGLILAAPYGLEPLLWTLVLYVAVSQVESNLITPMVQNHIASIPSILILFSVVGFASLLGPVGVVFATPLAVVLFTLIKTFYLKGQ